MKKLLALVLALAMVAAMVGCSSKSTESSSSAAVSTAAESVAESTGDTESTANWDTTKKDTIVLSVMNNYYTAGWKKMAEDYMKLHPETTVTVDVVADNDTLLQKFVTWQSSSDLSDAADIVHINFASGGVSALQQKNQCYDFTNLLDTTNPYTGKPVRACLDDGDIKANANEYGTYALPFDHVGGAVIVNTTMLEKYGLSVPTTFEEWLDCCQKLKDDGIDTPIIASPEGIWYVDVMADAAMRDKVGDFIVQPTDGAYVEKTMSADATYKYDPDNIACDRDVVFSGERQAIYEQGTQFKDDLTKSVWTEFAKIAPYFNYNWQQSASAEDLTSFESGNGAFLVSGSWNVGVLNADINGLGDKGFEWKAIAFPDFATKPEGWASAHLRSVYAMGNTMGILLTQPDNQDHLNRVLDFYMYVYNPTGCADMYMTTLDANQFIQGPPAIQGVDLPEDITSKLAGFVQVVSERDEFGAAIGAWYYMADDQGVYLDLYNQMSTGKITVDEFVNKNSEICMKKLADDIATQGYDMDPSTKDTPKS